jgi:tyrosine-protein phosphatase SIW14
MRSALLLLIAVLACAADVPRARPAHWAQPMLGGKVGNWFQVTPELYRSEQPSDAEMRALETFGIKAVLNLRNWHSDTDEVKGTTIIVSEVKTDAGDMTYAQLVVALKALIDAPKPALVHCWHGSDRTGTVVAGWRVAMQGWSPADALDEMRYGGFGHHEMFDNLHTLILSLDRTRLRADLGLPPAAP